MSKTVLHDGDEGVLLIVRDARSKRSRKDAVIQQPARSPVHVVYGGAHLFKAGTPVRLGQIALKTLDEHTPNFAAFANTLGFKGVIPKSPKELVDIQKVFQQDPEKLRSENYDAWLAISVYERTKAKLAAEPVEDLRIDFEDGYGFRPDSDEDADAAKAASELAAAFNNGSITAFCGFRLKAYSSETRERARRTLSIFLGSLLEATHNKLPSNFVVTLPKVTDKKEVAALCRDLKKIEKKAGLKSNSIKIEIMIEHPLAIVDKKGDIALRGLAEAADGRCVAAHFGAYDHTAALGIAASHQDIAHPACDLARQMMLVSLKPLGVRLSDSVTPLMPVKVHKGDKLSASQKKQNQDSVAAGLRVHFQNVTRSMSQGFYQSWDLHPNQLIARYAAVYAFFLEALGAQASRLRSFIEKATQATLTGNAFDDAATAMGIVNFLRQGLDCGALSEDEIIKAAGLTAAQLRLNSFKKILESK